MCKYVCVCVCISVPCLDQDKTASFELKLMDIDAEHLSLPVSTYHPIRMERGCGVQALVPSNSILPLLPRKRTTMRWSRCQLMSCSV